MSYIGANVQDLLTLNAAQIEALATARTMMSAMKRAFIAYSGGKVWVPLRTRWPNDGGLTFLNMAAASNELGLSVVKTLAIKPAPVQNLPYIQGVITAFNSVGTPVAQLDADSVTALRTAAGSAVAVDLMSRPDAEVLAVFGTGPQAEAHIEAITSVRRIRRILLFGLHAAKIAVVAQHWRSKGLEVLTPSTLADLKSAHIICTATTATMPLFDAKDVGQRAHIVAIGSYRPDMRELPGDLLREAQVYVDSATFCATEAGELLDAFGSPEEVMSHVTELGAVIDGWRARGTAPTIYKAVGNASQDLFAVAEILDRANAQLNRNKHHV